MSMTDAEIAELGLTAGVIDDAARHVFTFSHCDELAHALHRATGYPMVIGTVDGQSKHSGVLRPDRQVLDIRGAMDIDEWLESCHCDAFVLDPEPDCFLFSMPDALTDAFARAVLGSVG